MPILETWADLERELRRNATWDWHWVIQREMSELGITPREAEVVTWLFRGAINKEIEHGLGIRPQTVKNHLTSMYHKAGVRSREQLILRLLGIFKPHNEPGRNNGRSR